MIRGEAVGKELKKGSGTPTVEASMCEHPELSQKFIAVSVGFVLASYDPLAPRRLVVSISTADADV